MKVLVIVVAYNFEPWIDRCLGSLRMSAHPVSTVVVDNCSQDRTVARIEADYSEVRLIKSQENLGFGRGNNLGLAIALAEGFDAVFLLNQDAWVEPETISVLAGLLPDHPDFGVLSPVHLTGSGDGLDQGFAAYVGIRERAELPVSDVAEAAFINAAFWMIPVGVLRKVGGFSPLFSHYGEDKDYVNRLRYGGYRVGYSPRVFGYHDRADRTVSPQSLLRSEQVYLLSEYANPNHALPAAFAYGVLAGFKKAFLAVFRSSTGVSAKEYIRLSLHLLSRSREILRERKRIFHCPSGIHINRKK
jgi:GT2 family glycosyltransferase